MGLLIRFLVSRVILTKRQQLIGLIIQLRNYEEYCEKWLVMI